MDLSRRSQEREIIDDPAAMPPGEMSRVLRELGLVNRWLGGLGALRPALRCYMDQARAAGRVLRILDLGCGGADIPREIVGWGWERGCRVRVVGIDFNLDACRLAAEGTRSTAVSPWQRGHASGRLERPKGARPESADILSARRKSATCADSAEWTGDILPHPVGLSRLKSHPHPRSHFSGTTDVQVVAGDVFRLPFRPGSFDLAIGSAFLHHFEDAQIGRLLADLARVCRQAILINDLHRHRLAYWSIRLLTRLFSRSEAVKNDGPLSVRKGFRRSEIFKFVADAGLPTPRVRRRWAFRWVVEISLSKK